jgi:hypothetical protein
MTQVVEHLEGRGRQGRGVERRGREGKGEGREKEEEGRGKKRGREGKGTERNGMECKEFFKETMAQERPDQAGRGPQDLLLPYVCPWAIYHLLLGHPVQMTEDKLASHNPESHFYSKASFQHWIFSIPIPNSQRNGSTKIQFPFS